MCQFDDAAEDGKAQKSTIKKGSPYKFKMKSGITMDSGAEDNVIPRRMINHKNIRPSEASRRGLNCAAACSTRIPNEGKVDLRLSTKEGFEKSLPFQVADVNKPAGSVADRVDSSFRVIYDKDMSSGKDLTTSCTNAQVEY